MLVYVDGMVSEDYKSSIRNLGSIVYSDKATRSFLEDLRIKKNTTKLRLCVLSEEYDKNLQYAKMMSESLKELDIKPEQTRLVLLGTDERKGIRFANIPYFAECQPREQPTLSPFPCSLHL